MVQNCGWRQSARTTIYDISAVALLGEVNKFSMIWSLICSFTNEISYPPIFFTKILQLTYFDYLHK